MTDGPPDNTHWLQETLDHVEYMKKNLDLEINRLSELGKPIYGYFRINSWIEALNKWIRMVSLAENYPASQHEAATLTARLLVIKQRLENVEIAGNKSDAFLSVVNPVEIQHWIVSLRSIIAKLQSTR